MRKKNQQWTMAKGKTYCYKYFRPYKYDWRLFLTNDNGESIECTCPRARIHDKKCVWGITPITSISQILEMIFPKVNKQHKEKSMICTKTPNMDNKNHVDVVQQLK